VSLAEYLPLEPTVHQELLAFSPRGSVRDVMVKWTGQWPRPLSYSAKGRFNDLALKGHHGIPGFSGLSGSLDGDDRGGAFAIDTRRATLDLSAVFRAPLEFDSLTAQAAWTRREREFELKLSNVAFANPHAAGSLYGVYRGAVGTAGSIDLTGNLTRADARFVPVYIPRVVSPDARAWLDRAFLTGSSADVRLRLKGDLDQYPFPEGRGGLFEVTAHVSGGTLAYAEGWPAIENIKGDLVFRGQRMEVAVADATLMGTRLARVQAEIPDLMAERTALVVQGEAEGPTSEFLRFIAASPVDEHVHGFTRGMRASGAGKLDLRLNMPLDRPEGSRVAGSYRFLSNRVEPGPEGLALEQVNGVLDFTESSVRMRGATAQVLGGSATLDATTQPDGSVRITGAGRIDAEGLRRSSAHVALRRLKGATDWRAVVNVNQGKADWNLESSLQGLGVELPAPLLKTAAEALPLRLEGRPAGEDRVLIQGSLGRIVSWSLLRGTQGGNEMIERGGVSFGGSAVLPDRKGVWVYGTVDVLDLDQWRALLGGRDAGAAAEFAVGGLDLRAGTLDVLGKRFSDLHVNATHQAGVWQTRLQGKDAVGEVQWRTQGKGAVTARLKQLMVPPDAPVGPPETAAGGDDSDLPALDIVVDSFGIRDKQLGKLELLAQPQDREWKIERLKITNPEGTLQATGRVQRDPRRTQLNLGLEILDAGKLLARLGYPGAMKWGNGRLDGDLSWSGPAHAIDYPTLSGVMKLEAYRGQFLKIEPGAGKLLGILSLQALPRRLLLDFRDVVDTGFEFDALNATATV
ncbi:MAG TPA: YhdP family protein, partial [Burkholderiales bacterium]|nr:YhdP family protein [Burkholderiales bacterium]